METLGACAVSDFLNTVFVGPCMTAAAALAESKSSLLNWFYITTSQFTEPTDLRHTQPYHIFVMMFLLL